MNIKQPLITISDTIVWLSPLWYHLKLTFLEQMVQTGLFLRVPRTHFLSLSGCFIERLRPLIRPNTTSKKSFVT